MNAFVIICSFVALTVVDYFVWKVTISMIRRRAVRIAATEVKDHARVREDPWSRAYISIGTALNFGLVALAYTIKSWLLT